MAMDVVARDDTSDEALAPPLSQAVGYVVVVVVGLIIAFGMVIVTRILKRTVGEDNEKTEVFMTANRSVTRGLTSSAVISAWLWSTAMLGSSLVGYQYGVSGPFWFAAGCSPMIVFFALLGISCKRKIPEAHTLLEIVRIRYGNVAHIVYMVLCLLNNLFGCANMLLGASAVIAAMTGMHIIAATFLLPVGVALYTFVGGIKATFLTDYLHTFIILIILCFFTAKAFTFDEVGSLSNLFEIFRNAGLRHPVSGNHDGSYLTMTSQGGIFFGIIHICANFGLVIMDTSFFIKAFAASPLSSAYFAIPWAVGTLASSMVVGLENNPIFPTFPRRMTTTEVSNGLVLPYAFVLVAGKGGAACILLITFMAVTSTLSAQVIAVSSIISFDMYGNPLATDADVIRSSHYGVLLFSLIAAAFSTLLHYVGIDLGWTLYMLGVITCPGIIPTALAILWRRQSRAAAIVAPVLGMATGIGVWLGAAHALHGDVSIASTGATLPCMYGTVAPLPYTVVITWIGPENYDWADFRKERLAFEVEASGRDAPLERAVEGGALGDGEAGRRLKRWGRVAAGWAVATFVGHWVLWPLPMYAAKYVFGEKFFAAWLVVAIACLWGTLLIAGFYPLIDGRDQILAVWRGLRGGGRDASTRNAHASPGDSVKGGSAVDVIAKMGA
ncbi:Sodium:solute symporter family-domain-containing protein [Macrophomina phaseolina]|uniref:Sodium:solute symporter family-domain-containing protein n=1 Tax=Macrophomina phaseolina TaxID=35725 RepID=A0ABQ8GRT7_9PEZI|nr:Sodium:solute symporter family-domain-containing protein [Macrophomina phaseolina]